MKEIKIYGSKDYKRKYQSAAAPVSDNFCVFICENTIDSGGKIVFSYEGNYNGLKEIEGSLGACTELTVYKNLDETSRNELKSFVGENKKYFGYSNLIKEINSKLFKKKRNIVSKILLENILGLE